MARESRTKRKSAWRARGAPSIQRFPSRADYAYLLGLYLGDGCISRAGARDKEVWKLRVICADAWPGLIRECERAVRSIRPDNKAGIQQKPGCAEVSSYSRHWLCLFPQHGPGRKHMRTIELTSWQRAIVAENPGHFARGLFHSDGYRGMTGQDTSGEG
jgi:hypothetical protein